MSDYAVSKGLAERNEGKKTKTFVFSKERLGEKEIFPRLGLVTCEGWVLELAFEGLVEGFSILGHEENKQTQIYAVFILAKKIIKMPLRYGRHRSIIFVSFTINEE